MTNWQFAVLYIYQNGMPKRMSHLYGAIAEHSLKREGKDPSDPDFGDHKKRRASFYANDFAIRGYEPFVRTGYMLKYIQPYQGLTQLGLDWAKKLAEAEAI